VNNWRVVGSGAMTMPFVPNVMNEYDLVGGVRQAHDENGNLLDDGQRRFFYDVFNRLIRVESKMSGAVIAVYSYDAHHRRVMKRTGQETTLFFYDGWRDIEEQDASGRTGAQYVNGRWTDEVITMDRDVRGDGRLETFFCHDNAAVRSAAALTDSQGRVVERYNYDLYGEPVVTTASGATRLESAVGNPFLYQGRRLDAETGLYYYRHRYYNPQNGRFLQRDPLGFWHDAVNRGNPMAYVGNNPWNRTDPAGLQSWAGPEAPRGHVLDGDGVDILLTTRRPPSRPPVVFVDTMPPRRRRGPPPPKPLPEIRAEVVGTVIIEDPNPPPFPESSVKTVITESPPVEPPDPPYRPQPSPTPPPSPGQCPWEWEHLPALIPNLYHPPVMTIGLWELNDEVMEGIKELWRSWLRGIPEGEITPPPVIIIIVA
jgi:RHS repeat-associated protein